MLSGPDGVSRHMLSSGSGPGSCQTIFSFLASSAAHTAITIESGTFAWVLDREAAEIRGEHVIDESLFAFSFPAQSLGYFFVNFPPMVNGENSDHSGFAIRFVDNAKPPDFHSPQPGQFSDQWHTGERVGA